MYKYRRAGIGRYVARNIFDMFPWKLGAKAASAKWRRCQVLGQCD